MPTGRRETLLPDDLQQTNQIFNSGCHWQHRVASWLYVMHAPQPMQFYCMVLLF
jgi:hypothetical protein